MNEFNNHKPIEQNLEETANGIQPNAMFAAELEEKLRQAHRPRRKLASLLPRNLVQALTGFAALAALTLSMVWLLKAMDFRNTPGESFACPVTAPNGSLPPGETVASKDYLGNGELWTSLWPDGRVIMDEHNRETDGSFSMKWGFVRGVTGPLTVTGRRLDADAEPLRADIPDGYGDTGFQVTALIFPSTGCWEVTAHVGESSLTFVTEVIFGEATPTPEVHVQATSEAVVENPIESPAPQGEAFDWNGTTLYLNATMPDPPAEMKIYLQQDEIRATLEDAQSLAARFKMNGGIYEVPGEMPNTIEFIVIDGNRRLRIRSDRYFTYYPNYADYSNAYGTMDNPNATALINDFLIEYGFNETYKIQRNDDYIYFALPQTPDGYVIHEDTLLENGLGFRFSQSGILSAEANLTQYDLVQPVTLISAQTAFERLIDPFPMHDNIQKATSIGLNGIRTWARVQPLDVTQTYFGWLNTTGRSVTGGDPYIAFNEIPVAGNTAGIGENMQGVFIETSGYYHEEGGTLSFVMDSWKALEGYEENYIGSLQAENGGFILIAQDGQRLTVTDLPADLPLPAKDISISGVTQGDVFNWRTIYNGPLGGGGGGGGGLGFFKLNLSGTPIPLPTQVPTPTPEPLSTAPLEGVHGIVTVTIFDRSDGTQRREYVFLRDASVSETSTNYYILEGDGLEALDAYHHLPIVIWGTPTTDSDGLTSLRMERFEVPYPDLKFQLLNGAQTLITANGQSVTLLTMADGTQYATLYADGTPSNSLINNDGDQVTLEALLIPGETFEGYPALRFFGGGLSQNPTTGEPFEYVLNADQPIETDEMPQFGAYTATIENVDLVYYTPNLRYNDAYPYAEPPYIQPVWRFSGHYSNGDGFEFLMQAVEDKYLLPAHIFDP